MEHIPLIVTYAPAITMKPATMKIQIESPCPSALTEPSALVDENRTKYPTTNQNVAGIKLKKKHISLYSCLWRMFYSLICMDSRRAVELDVQRKLEFEFGVGYSYQPHPQDSVAVSILERLLNRTLGGLASHNQHRIVRPGSL